MYVCVCNALKVDTVRCLAAEGLSFEEIQAITNCSGNCGSCREFAQTVVDSVRKPHTATSFVPVLSTV